LGRRTGHPEGLGELGWPLFHAGRELQKEFKEELEAGVCRFEAEFGDG